MHEYAEINKKISKPLLPKVARTVCIRVRNL